MKTTFISDSFKALKIGRVYLRTGKKDGAIYYNPVFVNSFVFIPRNSENIGICAPNLCELCREIDQEIFFQGRFYISLNKKGKKINA